MRRMSAPGDQANLLAREQRPDVDAKAKFFLDLAPDGLSGFLALLYPSAGKAPRKVGSEYMLDQQHTTDLIEHDTQRANRLPWRLEPGHGT
jgi:hypothetical protein